MTARSLELIASADTILHDRLIPPGALAGARPDAELAYVGKAPEGASGGPEGERHTGSVPQEEINEKLVEAARAGRSVVRLKGGDPFVFGRGGEEGEALRAAGIEFEVVPGVTAGVAATDPARVLSLLFVAVSLVWWGIRRLEGRRHPSSAAGLALGAFLVAAAVATLEELEDQT